MLPLSKKDAQPHARSLLANILPETLLLTLPAIYFVGPVFLMKTIPLIESPLKTTWIYMCLNALLQSFVLCHLWKWSKGLDNIKETKFINSKNWLKGSMSVIMCWLVLHYVCILFGAPFFASIFETTTWAMLATTLFLVPGLCILGTDHHLYLRVIIGGLYENQTERFMYFLSLCMAICSWISPIVIPLDWDRPWQKWPIPCIVGVVIGYSIGVFMSLIVTIRERKTAKLN